jgi:hypothetical protein
MTQGYTEIEYGTGTRQVKLSNCQTLKFEQEPIFDSSGINPVYTRFTIRVAGYLLAQTIAQTQIIPNKGAVAPNYVQTAGSQDVALRHFLDIPRQEFRMTLGVSGPAPTVLLHAKPMTSTGDQFSKEFDCQGGPIPKVISVENIVGNTSIKIQWEVVVCIVPDCDQYSSGNGNNTQKKLGILSNRWTCADDIDENFYLRSRTFVGELKLANPLVNPHDFRELVVPAITPGMRLKSMSFRQSEDQLNLQYTVVHEEVTVTAPAPATGIRISHKVSHNEYAIEIDESLAITLTGDRHVNKQQLVALAASIADGKLRTNELNNKTFRLMRYEMSDECGTSQQNQVTVMYQTRHITAQADAFPNQGAFIGITRRFGSKPDGTMIPNYDNTKTKGNRPNEKPDYVGNISVVGAFAAHLQSNCTTDYSANAGISGKEVKNASLAYSISPAPNLPELTVTTVSSLGDLPPATFNGSQSQGIYQSYEIDVQVEEQPLIFQAPLSPSLSDSLFPPQTSTGTTTTPPTTTTTPTNPTTGDTSVFIRGGPSQWERVVRVLAKRHGVPPRLSNPRTSFRDPNGVLHVLKKRTELTAEPQRGIDGVVDYIVRAEYRYGLSRPPTKLQFGLPDYAPAQSLGSIGAEGPYSFSLATVYSSDHPIG